MSFQRVSTCTFVCTQRELDWDWCWKSSSFERMEHTEETPWINQSMSSGDGGNGKGKKRREWGEGRGANLNTAERWGISVRTLCSDKKPWKADWAVFKQTVCKQIHGLALYSHRALLPSSTRTFFHTRHSPVGAWLVFKHASALMMSTTLTCSHLWDTTTFSQQKSRNNDTIDKKKKKKCCLSKSFWFAPVFWDSSNSQPADTTFSRPCRLARTYSFFLSSLPWYMILIWIEHASQKCWFHQLCFCHWLKGEAIKDVVQMKPWF